MRVLKFGGSSLADFDCLKRVKQLIESQAGEQALVVLSAPGGMTDQLVELAKLAEQGVDYSVQWQALLNRADSLKREVEQLDSVVTHWPSFAELSEQLAGVKLLKHCPEQVNAFVISFGERVSVALMVAMLGHRATYLEATECIETQGGYLDAEVNLVASEQRFADTGVSFLNT